MTPTTLSQQLLADPTRPTVMKDLVAVIQQEVASKRGIGGAALKAGYAAASKVVPNLTERGLARLGPDLLRALDPFWADFAGSGGTDFGDYLARRDSEVSGALLGVTDAKVAASGKEPVKKAYQALRGKADAHVQAALPRLGSALQRHASSTGS